MATDLSQNERSTIQQMSVKWTSTLKPKRVIPALHSKTILTHQEKQYVDSKQTDYEKNEYLFEHVLCKSTYQQLCAIRQILVDSDVGAHMALAKSLPVRNGDHFWEKRNQQEVNRHHTQRQGATYWQPQYNNHYKSPQAIPAAKPDRSKIFPNRASPSNGFEANTTPNVFRQNVALRPSPVYQNAIRPEAPIAPSPNIFSPSVPPTEDVTEVPRLGMYGTKANWQRRTGKGYCLVIANFLTDFKEYNKDIKLIESFFRQKLNYTVKIFVNQCHTEFTSVLTETKNLLNKDGTYDRLFVFILSHGDENGIKCCLSDGKTTEYDKYVKTEHIINEFKHDEVKALKGYPKVFFIQACQGEELARAASSASLCDEEIAVCAANADRITAVGADVLVCRASQPKHYCWVNESEGSWLIQASLDIFQKYHTTEHLVDMITEINNELSTKTQKFKAQNVYQLPDVSHNLTKKFYLKIPN